MKPSDPKSRIKALNSQNHAGFGQNVLYMDGHVSWNETSFCGYQGENIYLAGVGDKQATGDVPQGINDAVLLPRGPQWLP
ncbi:MAG TPA: hypothetical protein VHP11_07535 [Tepidisphaeraceae bacterium]|nr:hypothetical protein [Tepidisphaeraceae bacterium]